APAPCRWLPGAPRPRSSQSDSARGTPLQAPVQKTSCQSWESIKAKCGNANAGIPIVGIRGAKTLRSRSVFVLGYVMISIAKRKRRNRGGNLLLKQSALGRAEI